MAQSSFMGELNDDAMPASGADLVNDPLRWNFLAATYIVDALAVEAGDTENRGHGNRVVAADILLDCWRPAQAEAEIADQIDQFYSMFTQDRRNNILGLIKDAL